ncbi:MAG: rhodanese-like domain-containing protein [Leptospira sp.]|nr:rhodanese-like domain-containing protein [Leptospira sp.]
MNAIDLKKRLDDRNAGKDNFILLDVRNPNEQEICIIPGTDLLIPVTELDSNLSKLENYKKENKEIIIYCRSGGRSMTAFEKLKTRGFMKILNLAGGILSYSSMVDPSLPRY